MPKMPQTEQAIPFDLTTRRKVIQLSTMTRPTGGGITQIELPKSGILSQIYLAISVTIAGTLSAPNALGLASVIKRVRVRINSGNMLFDLDGFSYHYGLREALFNNLDRLSYTDARSAVTTGTKNLDMIIPIALNDRDTIGLVMLQNESTQVVLEVEWEADATVATGATITGTAVPSLVLFEVPSNPKSFPDFSILHQCLSDLNTTSAGTTYDYQVARGGTIVGLYHMLGSSTWTQAQLILQQSNVIENHNPQSQRIQFAQTFGHDNTLSGTFSGNNTRVFYDFSGDDGLGQYGSKRDMIDTNSLTSFISRLTIAGAANLYTVRRQLLRLGG